MSRKDAVSMGRIPVQFKAARTEMSREDREMSRNDAVSMGRIPVQFKAARTER